MKIVFTISIHLTLAITIRNYLKKFKATLNFWSTIEADFGHKCDQYEIQFDIAEIVYKWTSVENERHAVEIFRELDYWGIFIGDFVKAILKINTIADEVKKVATLTENLALLEKMNEISKLTLKSVITNHSLYL